VVPGEEFQQSELYRLGIIEDEEYLPTSEQVRESELTPASGNCLRIDWEGPRKSTGSGGSSSVFCSRTDGSVMASVIPMERRTRIITTPETIANCCLCRLYRIESNNDNSNEEITKRG